MMIFTVPKPFTDQIAIIQRNAIQSWMKLIPQTKIILMGNEKGVTEAAKEFGVVHIKDIECNEFGTPLVSSAFKEAKLISNTSVLMYINTDIILVGGLSKLIDKCKKRLKRFLVVGRRWDVDVTEPIDFNENGWQSKMIDFAKTKGKLHSETGIDYFVFSADAFDEIPPFAIGRFAWDNWLLWKARHDGMAVIDATDMLTAIHQNHSSMIKDGKKVREKEIQANRQLADDHIFDIIDCNYIAGDGWIKPARDVLHIERRMERMAEYHPVLWRLICSWKLRCLYCWLRLSL